MSALPYRRLAGFYFFYFAYLGSFAPFFSLYLADVGMTAVEIGVLMSIPQLTRIVAPQLWGWLADRSASRLRIARLAMAYVCYGSERAYRAHLDSILTEHRAIEKAVRERSADDADRLAASHANLARIRVTSYLGNSLTAAMSLADLAIPARAA